MPDSKTNPKLLAVLLGGMAKGCNIELHDVQFIVTDTIEDGYSTLLDKWFGLKEKMHIDSYIHLDVVDGYKISLERKKIKQDQKLYFINMGAYEEGNFSELHQIKFMVDTAKLPVKKRAKETMLIGKDSVHTDDLFEVDDCIHLSSVDGWEIKLTPTSEKENLIPVNGYHPIPKAFLRTYLDAKI